MPVKKCNKIRCFFFIAYFNIPENIINLINIIQWIIIHSLAYSTAFKPKTVV